MTLGERCDEIVRLIDETLGACAAVAGGGHRSADRRIEDDPEPELVGVA
jgi:hypothetical protein